MTVKELIEKLSKLDGDLEVTMIEETSFMESSINRIDITDDEVYLCSFEEGMVLNLTDYRAGNLTQLNNAIIDYGEDCRVCHEDGKWSTLGRIQKKVLKGGIKEVYGPWYHEDYVDEWCIEEMPKSLKRI